MSPATAYDKDVDLCAVMFSISHFPLDETVSRDQLISSPVHGSNVVNGIDWINRSGTASTRGIFFSLLLHVLTFSVTKIRLSRETRLRRVAFDRNRTPDPILTSSTVYS